MFFCQFQTDSASLSYLFGCGSLGKAIAVDVVEGQQEIFLQETERAGVRITHVIETHIHADRLSGGRLLAELTGAAYCLHERNEGQLGFPFSKLRDGMIIEVGNVEVQVLHTPGHTEDSICLLVSDRRRSAEPWFALTGDTLFVGSTGRPDLAGMERQMATELYASLHQKLLPLPDHLEIFPAHRAGSVCGAGLSGKPSSTLGYERRFNPLLSLNESDFVDALVGQTPARPANMREIIDTNMGKSGLEARFRPA